MYKIMLIDDEPLNFPYISQLADWESLGFEICAKCTSGHAALEAILSCHPDVVFTDINMPDMSGLDLIASVRRRALDAEFVIVTAYRNFSYACRALEQQAFAYLLKPLSKEELLRVLPRLSERLREKAHIDVPTYDMQYPKAALTPGFITYLEKAAVCPHNRVLLSDRPAPELPDPFIVHPVSIRQFPSAYLLSSAQLALPSQITYGCSRTFSDFSSFPEMAAEAQLAFECEFLYTEHRLISDVQSYIAANYAMELTIPLLAQNFNLSESYLCNMFKKYTDTTIVNFIRHVRIHRAMRLIRFSMEDILSISETVGYSSYSYFGKQFKEVTGMTPTRYKKEFTK